jgi:hypothetical protein
MCNNCNCDGYNKCSIVGYLPFGFCCSHCFLYNETHTCLSTKTKHLEENSVSKGIEGELKLISSSIEGSFLRVVIENKGEEIPIDIDLKKHLENKEIQ